MPRSAPDRDWRAALRWSLTAAAAVIGICGAYFLDGYWLRALTEVFLIATVAQSINIIAGFTGYPAFGQVVFFGLGNYAAAIAMTTLEASFLVGALLGSVICAGFALLCGWPLFRLKGHYFAIATLGLNEAVKAVVSNWVSLTKGGAGISLPLPSGPVLGNTQMFYIAFLALMWLSVVIVWSLRRTRFGFACRAIRADEEAAMATGINTLFYKTGAWMLSAVLAGWAGSLYAYWQSYIEPSVAFDIDISVKGFVIVLLGGLGSALGPIVAAFALQLISTLVWSHLLTLHLGLMGLLIMAAVLFPQEHNAWAALRSAVAARLRRVELRGAGA
jgi:branched-chain amino acid transport system permease protein